MTLDEAIAHAEEVVERMGEMKNQYQSRGNHIVERWDTCDKCAEEHNQLAEWLKDYKRLKAGGWIPTAERMPDNANDPGAFCPRYQVMTESGVTEGWYRPHDNGIGGQWYALFWFMSEQFEIWNVDFERGCVPKVIGNTRVLAWAPIPEAYTEGLST